MAAMQETMNAANAAGIAGVVAAHGLSADEGKAKARGVGNLYWRVSGRRRSFVEVLDLAGREGGRLFTGVREGPRSRERRWWEFWK